MLRVGPNSRVPARLSGRTVSAGPAGLNTGPPNGARRRQNMGSQTMEKAQSQATISFNGTSVNLPVVKGSEGELGIDIQQLRSATGYITLDPGYGNTGACHSAITFIDGEKGILRYRGYPIE